MSLKNKKWARNYRVISIVIFCANQPMWNSSNRNFIPILMDRFPASLQMRSLADSRPHDRTWLIPFCKTHFVSFNFSKEMWGKADHSVYCLSLYQTSCVLQDLESNLNFWNSIGFKVFRFESHYVIYHNFHKMR